MSGRNAGDIARTPGRSHPPSLLRLVERCLRDEGKIQRGEVILVACSGGPDSTALLHALAHLQKKLGHIVVAHGVDHGLRAEAQAELALAQQVAEAAGVRFTVSRLDVREGGNLQARARAARFQALAEAAESAGARFVATGHTADDRAETLLLRLLRGAGPRGLAVLPPVAPPIAGTIPLIRPLIHARRADVLAHLQRHRLAFAEDPSNRDPRFSRVRVRRELLPLLEELSPRIVEHLSALAEMLAHEGAGEDPLAGLGRAQRQTVERARTRGEKRVLLRVAGGEEVSVIFPGDQIVPTKKA
ncbi:MAG: tRNA lysidine(34) synthetase TilS [Minicystis sp.]